MIDVYTAALLQNLLRRASRSCLQFVGEAYPWTSPDEEPALGKLLALIEEDRQALAALGRFLVRHRIDLPYLGTYPEYFTTLSFVALDFLLPRLAEEQRQAIAALESDLAGITVAEARPPVERILEVKRRHLPVLEEMAASHTQAAVRT